MSHKKPVLLFIIISYKALASLQGEALICDEDRRGYNFTSKDEVKVLSINFDELKIISINHLYELEDNVILIQQPLTELNKEKKTEPIGWIFRRTLDYVSLDYINGDWSRKFLWSCKITSSDQLDKRLKNKIDKLIKASGNKMKEFN